MKIGYLMQAGVPDVRQSRLSGPANHVKQVFKNLIDLGHQLRLLALLDGQVWRSDDLEIFEPVKVNWLDKSLARRFESVIRRVQSELHIPYAALFESLRFAQACRQELTDYDLFYERTGWVGYGGGLAARWLGIPLVFEVNGDHLSEMELLGIAPRGAQRWISTVLMKWAINQASFIVATGEGWRWKLIERWEVKPEIVEVIENGSEIIDLLKREKLRAFHNSTDSSQDVTIIYIGAFEPWHGVTKLIIAFSKAVEKESGLQLILVGSGSELDEIKKLVSELALEDNVILTGHLTPQEFAFHLAEADIGVAPYCGRVEYSGLKLLDYKAAGLAIIASGEGGQPAVIEHSQTGWIVPPCNENALSDSIVRLARDVDLRHKMGRNSRTEAEQSHTWRYTAEQLIQVFNTIARD